MDITQRLHISKHILYLVGGAFLLLTLFGGLLWAGAPKPTPTKNQGKIQEIVLESDAARLRIKRNGLVEITTGDRTVFQFWDQDRVDRLFALLERTDWSNFGSRLRPGQKGYLLTIKTAAGDITIAIPEGSIDLPEGVKELITLFEELVEQVNNPTPSPSSYPILPQPSPSAPLFGSPTPSPTPTPTPVPWPSSFSPTPTPSPAGGGSGGGSIQEPFVCAYTGSTAKRRILSETLCDLVE